MDERDVVILLVGDELLSGRTRDANGAWLAARLDDLGHRVRRIVVLPDVDTEIRAEVREALRRAPTVLVSGGLGPTHDDRTTLALAAEFGRSLVVDEAAWENVVRRYEKRFGSIGEAPPGTVESARKMVRIPEGARVLPNPVGAAVGYVLEGRGGRVLVFPGVPAELQATFDREVAGSIVPALDRDTVVELDVSVPEAAFADALSRIQDEFPDVALGSYPHFGEARVTLRFRGAEARTQEALDRAREALDGHVLKERPKG